MSHILHIRSWLARPGMLIRMPRQVSNHSYVQSRDCQENHRSCLQKGVRLQPPNDGPALSWHVWTRLISVTMTTQHKIPKCHWDQKLANANQLFPFCSKDISEHNPFKGSSTTYVNTMCENSLGTNTCTQLRNMPLFSWLSLPLGAATPVNLGITALPFPRHLLTRSLSLEIKESVHRCHVRTLLFTYLLL